MKAWPQARVDYLSTLTGLGDLTQAQVAAQMSDRFHCKITVKNVADKVVDINEARKGTSLPPLQFRAESPPLLVKAPRKTPVIRFGRDKLVKAKSAFNPAAPTRLPEIQALKQLRAMFDFNTQANDVENGPHAVMSPKPRRCAQKLTAGRCDLAIKKTETLCPFHKEMTYFSATGYERDDIYDSAPAEAKIRDRITVLDAARTVMVKSLSAS